MNRTDPRPSIQRRNSTLAVVIGGSIAGLLAARVLSDFFDRVIVLDRDRLPESPGFRAGVPQSRHVHVLMPRGRHLLDRMFPGISTELLDAGVESIRWPRDVLHLTIAGWSQRFDHQSTDVNVFSMSRELFEWHLRRKVTGIERVEVLQGRNVTGLLPGSDCSGVSGVIHADRGGDGDASQGPRELHADLVVDASGRNSRTPQWLVELGYDAPQESRVNSFLGYASRCYRRPDAPQRDWKAQFLQQSPPEHLRGGGIMPLEGNRWIVTLAGVGDHTPPTDEDGYLEFARSIRVPTLYEAIRNAEPLTPVYGYRSTENRLRHYDRLRRFPERLVVTGDALCAFNPIYGQGMSVAALEAETLNQVLTDHSRRRPAGDLTGVSRRYHRLVARNIGDAWLLATGDDLRYPTTEGARPDLLTRGMHRFLDRAIRVGTRNAHVNETIIGIFAMLNRPTALFHPRVLSRVVLGDLVTRESTPSALPGLSKCGH